MNKGRSSWAIYLWIFAAMVMVGISGLIITFFGDGDDFATPVEFLAYMLVLAGGLIYVATAFILLWRQLEPQQPQQLDED